MGNSLNERLGKTKFTIFDSALACLLFIIFNYIFVEIYRLLPSNIVIYYFAQFLIEFLFAVVAFIVAKCRKYKFFEAVGATKKVSRKMVGLALLTSLVCLIFFGDLTDAFIEILFSMGYTSQLSSLEINTIWELLIYTVVSCATPAICEEILFRGTILSGLKSFGMKVAVAVSAVIFTLMHGNAEQTIHQFIIGLIIGAIFFKTGNLWIGVLIHFFNNFFAILSAYFIGLLGRSGLIEMASDVQNARFSIVQGALSEGGEVFTLNWLSIILDIVFAVVLAGLGFTIIKVIIRKLVAENERVNGTSVEAELQGETTINVDGSEVVTTMTIDGEEVNPEETVAVAGDLQVGAKEKSKAISIPTILLFALSGVYLVFNWLLSLISGFL